MLKKNCTAKRLRNESGMALFLTLFFIAIAYILIIGVRFRALFDMHSSRAFTDGIQANFVLKSGISLGRVILEMDKPEGVTEDSFNEAWYGINSAPTINIPRWSNPIPNFPPQVRLMIVDETGKIDINSIQAQGLSPRAAAWRSFLGQLFQDAGFQREQYSDSPPRTPGNVAYDAKDQVAVIVDWIDSDSESYNGPDGEGIESSADKALFFNRKLASLSELALIPGMTKERIERIAPFVTVSTSPAVYTGRTVNVNTAPVEVLRAMDPAGSLAQDAVEIRQSGPIKSGDLQKMITGQQNNLNGILGVTSQEFSIFCQVTMPNTTKWLRATIPAPAPFRGKRKTSPPSSQLFY